MLVFCLPYLEVWEKDEILTFENLKKLAKLAQEFSEQFLASLYAQSIAANESAVFNELIDNTVREELAEIILIIADRLKVDKK